MPTPRERRITLCCHPPPERYVEHAAQCKICGWKLIEAHPERQLVYSSPRIHERRQRILKEARKLIAEKGLANFGVRELSKRADVAQRTLYNAFSSKERIAALAIQESFELLRQHVRYKTDGDTLEGMLDRIIAINRQNLGSPNFALAMSSIYFSPSTPADVWNILHHMAAAGITEMLGRFREMGELEDWVIIEDMAISYANMAYSTIHDWGLRRIGNEDYLRRMAEALLLLVVGCSRGDTQAKAEQYLQDIRLTGRLPAFPLPSWRAPAA